MAFQLGRLYPITASERLCGRSYPDQVRLYLAAGLRLFQLRDKELSDRALWAQVVEVNRECLQAGARLLINDRTDLALSSGAAGVHLGQHDLPAEAARKLLGPTAVIGLSTHTPEQFEKAQSLPIDYVAVGPIFATRSKQSSYEPLGLRVLSKVALRSRLPIVAIGGITLETSADVWSAGADSVAVISDIADCADPVQRMRQYLHLSEDHKDYGQH